MRALFLLLPLALWLSGCNELQSALHPRGPQAAQLADLFWLFTAVCGAIWVAVMVALGVALLRRRAPPARQPIDVDPAGERRSAVTVAVAVAATAVILIVFILTSYLATHSMAQAARGDALEIKLTGRQWWWDIEYQDAKPDRIVRTANEIHIPVGRPVRITLSAADVIHSFWVPNLTGKQDLIPGRHNVIAFAATRPGVYRGQCAEFCGLQHAHMGVLVLADAPDAFESWREAQLQPAAAPQSDEQRLGRETFLHKGCMACHTVSGTGAMGRLGPDLSHVGSRRMLAAATLPNSRGAIAGWIADPQRIKPGNRMPRVPLTPGELNGIAAYLEALK
jgi:cytochrome c oxidase subunit 2